MTMVGTMSQRDDFQSVAATATHTTDVGLIQNIMNRVKGLEERINSLSAYIRSPFGEPYLRNGSVVFVAPELTEKPKPWLDETVTQPTIVIEITPCYKPLPRDNDLSCSAGSDFAGLTVQIFIDKKRPRFVQSEQSLYPASITYRNAVACIANWNAFDDISKVVLSAAALQTPSRPGFTALSEFTDSLSRQRLGLDIAPPIYGLG